MARIYIEDEEGNFLYLNVGHIGLADSVCTTINAASNGSAHIERVLTSDELEELGEPPIGDLVSQWHASAELNEDLIELTLYRTADPGPMKEWRPSRTLLLDEAHATELLGTLALALERKRQLASEAPE